MATFADRNSPMVIAETRRSWIEGEPLPRVEGEPRHLPGFWSESPCTQFRAIGASATGIEEPADRTDFCASCRWHRDAHAAPSNERARNERLAAEAMDDVERAMEKPAPRCPDCGEPSTWFKGIHSETVPEGWYCRSLTCKRGRFDAVPTAPSSDKRREELKAKIMEALPPRTPARPPAMMSDASVASVLGVLDRAAIRSLLAELAIDGKIAIEATADERFELAGWVDGVPPWIVRLAPAGTPSLEDRIVAAVAGAGIDGVEEDLLSDDIVEDIAVDFLDPFITEALEGPYEAALKALVARNVIRDVGCGGGHYTLTCAEWARRAVKIVVDRLHMTVPDFIQAEIAPHVEDLLAGTEA